MEQLVSWIALAVAILGSTIGWLAVRKSSENAIKINDIEDSIKSLNNDVTLLDDVSQGLGKRLVELKTEVSALSELATEMPADLNSEEAIVKASGMLERGEPLELVATECGLPIGEVRLMEAMRRSKDVELEPEALL